MKPVVASRARPLVEIMESRRLLSAAVTNALKETVKQMVDCGCGEGIMQPSNTSPSTFNTGADQGTPVVTEGGGEATISVGPVVDISRASGNEAEVDIAINPTNPDQIIAVSNIASGTGLFQSFSNDGGVNWTKRIIATGSDGLTAACCDARIVYDKFGNAWMVYLNTSAGSLVIARSTNNGSTWTQMLSRASTWDNPAIGTGADGSTWVSARGSGGTISFGWKSTGLGTLDTTIGGGTGFSANQVISVAGTGNYGDVAVGNDGSVFVTWTSNPGGQGPNTDPIVRDPDGLGPLPFSGILHSFPTNVGGFDFIPPQNSRSVDSEPQLGIAPPGTQYAGRIYFQHLDETANENSDTDVHVFYSDDNGVNWTGPIRVNDDPASPIRSQMLNQLAVDPTTGGIVASWHDPRNDNGTGGSPPGGNDATQNNEVQFWAALSTDGGATWQNFMIDPGYSRASTSGNGVELGDWTGSDYYGGRFFAAWASNAPNIAATNPAGSLGQLDLATARVDIAGVGLPGIYGTVFDDANANGARDAGEAGINGATVFVDDNDNGNLDPGETNQVTGTSGTYSFLALAAGTYRIRAVTPAGLRPSFPAGGVYVVNYAGGSSIVSGQDFGFINPRVAGRVFNDANDNGVFDAAETGRSGVTVYFDANSNGNFDPGETNTTTDSSGNYIFGGLANGGYTVRIVNPAGTRQTFPTLNPNNAYAVNIGPGELVATGKDFGVTERVRLQGTVFGDNNANGVFEPGSGELGIGNARVYIDANNNGVFDNTGGTFNSTNVPLAVPPSGTSGITTSSILVSGVGNVSNLIVTIGNLTHTYDGDLLISLISPAGTRVTLSNRRGGSADNYINTVFDDTAATSITTGTAPFTGSFRPEVALSTLNGQNANGTWQLEINDQASGDSGTLNSWSITLGSTEANQLTGSGGTYSFGGLSGGNYVLRQEPIPGNTFTTPPGGVANLTTASGDLITTDFGNSSQIVSSSGFYVRVSAGGDMIEIFQDTVPVGAPDIVLDRASTTSINLVGSNSDDLLFVDLVNGNPMPTGGINFDGLAGSDTSILLGTAGDDTARFDAAQIRSGPRAINYTNTENIRFEGLGGDDRLISISPTAAPTFLGGPGANTLQVDAGTWTYNVDGNTQNESLVIDIRTGGAVTLNSTQHLESLLMAAGANATLTSGGNKLIRVSPNTLTMDPTAVLDLNDGSMIVDYDGASVLSTVKALLTSGYAGGAWNGAGIKSGAAAGSPAGDALGYGEASAVFSSFPASFRGESVDNTTVLIRYTLYGDANLDGTTNISDFSSLASNFNAAGTWTSGDFTYDNSVNISDFSVLAANFNLSAAAQPARVALTLAAPNPFGAKRIDEGSLAEDVIA